MNAEAARRNLELADSGLQAAIDRLIAMGPGVAGVRADFERCIKAVQNVSVDGATRRQVESLLPLMGRIRERAARAQILLEAATSFYCGAMTAAAGQSCNYTYDGAMQRGYGGGYIRVDA